MRSEARADIEGMLGFVETFMLVFAGISLFVGGFIISNTFSMSARQRMREFALLRAAGASPAQEFASILIQAAVVGLAGSALGVAGLAWSRCCGSGSSRWAWTCPEASRWTPRPS